MGPYGFTMTSHEIFTDAWAEAYKEKLNENEAYAEAGSDWEGPMAFLVRADPAQGLPEDRAVVLDLHHGTCRDAYAATAEEADEEADYVIQGSRSTWLDVLDGKLQPLKALMFGKLKLKKGSLKDLLPYTKAAKEMVESAQEVPTER